MVSPFTNWHSSLSSGERSHVLSLEGFHRVPGIFLSADKCLSWQHGYTVLTVILLNRIRDSDMQTITFSIGELLSQKSTPSGDIIQNISSIQRYSSESDITLVSVGQRGNRAVIVCLCQMLQKLRCKVEGTLLPPTIFSPLCIVYLLVVYICDLRNRRGHLFCRTTLDWTLMPYLSDIPLTLSFYQTLKRATIVLGVNMCRSVPNFFILLLFF